MQRLLRVGLPTLIALAMVAGCGGSTNSGASGSGSGGTGVIKIGVVAPMSGSGAYWGAGQKGGVELAADEVNDKGGLEIGGKKYTVKVVTYDDEYDAAKGVTATNRLVNEDNVKVIVGSTGGNVTQAIQPMITQNKVINLAGSYADILKTDNAYTFRIYPSPAMYSRAAAKWIKQNLPATKTVVVVGPNDDGGWSTSKAIAEGYKSAGYEVSVEYYDRNTKDFAPFITRVLAKKPDILETDGSPPGDAGQIYKVARQLGFKGNFCRLGGSAYSDMEKAVGTDVLEGLIYYQAYDRGDKPFQALEDRFHKKYDNKTMSDSLPSWYFGTLMALQAMQQAGTTTDTDKIAKALSELTYQTDWPGPLKWGGKVIYGVDRELLLPVFLAKVEKGKAVVAAKLTLE